MALRNLITRLELNGRTFGYTRTVTSTAALCLRQNSNVKQTSLIRRLNRHYGNLFSRGLSSYDSAKNIFSYRNVDYIVNVKTGDQLHAGTDANVMIILHGEDGKKTDPIKLDYFFRDDFERGQLDMFQLKNINDLKDIHKLELWRDNSGLGSNWFVDYIEIESIRSRKRYIFPFFRWIKADRHYIIYLMDNFLPQMDPDYRLRKEELEEKKATYHCTMKIPGGPAQLHPDRKEPEIKQRHRTKGQTSKHTCE